ncbi:nuclear transport factor 2 family protein [Nocardiopsis aegyptia]|uniref:Ketosteroid isomerase-like protein n=1 Tax=Nocardiopsis aegyptia TaxID=220378 RepID=A0A7Z0EHS3_9ACTN|nr:nuclear transport factor 2 family protein [Nocardiopsis aegyptia]NYJ32231.1 ketosteroid isomerase-like protein [Nocardiopsis aegyptia]
MTVSTDHPHVRTAVRYHQAVSRFARAEELSAFLHPEAVHTQLPNVLFPDGTVRDRSEVVSAAGQGASILRHQEFEVFNAVAEGDQVALEVAWSGTVAAPVGGLTAGQVLRAHVAAFLRFQDGLIVSQRNYDCYERLDAR